LGSEIGHLTARWARDYREKWAMKLFTGWAVSAGMVFVAAAANAQVLTTQVPTPAGIGPATRVSDVGSPYAAMPPGYGPRLLPPPKAPPHAARPEAAPAQQSAATAKPAEPQASPPSPTVGVAKPSVQIMPTQEMPKAQGLD
jgi:hypothetical protein